MTPIVWIVEVLKSEPKLPSHARSGWKPTYADRGHLACYLSMVDAEFAQAEIQSELGAQYKTRVRKYTRATP